MQKKTLKQAAFIEKHGFFICVSLICTIFAPEKAKTHLHFASFRNKHNHKFRQL